MAWIVSTINIQRLIKECNIFFGEGTERGAEWLGNYNRKTMIKIQTIGQMLPFENGTALPSPSQAPGWA